MTTAKIEILVGAQTGDAQAKLQTFATATQAILKKVTEGLALGLGISAVQTLVAKLNEIPAALERLVGRGIAFNRTLEDSQLGIAAILRQFSPDKFKTFDDAMKASAAAIELLKQKAKESPATFKDLVSAFQANAGAAMAANIPLAKQVDLVVLMSQALAGLGIRSEQITQESRALLTGNITEDAAAARILGITKAQVDNAKETGRLFEFLTDRLSAFAEAGRRGAETFSTRLSNLGDVVDQVLGKATVPLFQTMSENFQKLSDIVSQPQFEQGVVSIATQIERIVRAGLNLAISLTACAGAIGKIVETAVQLGAAVLIFSAFQLAARALNAVFIQMLAVQVASGETLTILSLLATSSRATFLALITTLETPIPPGMGVAAYLTLIVELIRAIREGWDAYQAMVIQDQATSNLAVMNDALLENVEKRLTALQKRKLELQIEAARSRSEIMPNRLDVLVGSGDKESIDEVKFQQERARLIIEAMRSVRTEAAKNSPPPRPDFDASEMIDEVNRKYQAATETKLQLAEREMLEQLRILNKDTKNTEEAEAAKNLAREIYARKRSEIEAKAEEDAYNEFLDMQEKRAQAHREILQRELQKESEALQQQRDSLATSRALIDVDFRTPEAQKRGPRIELMEKEISALDEVIARLRQKRDLEQDPAAREAVEQQIKAFNSERSGVARDRAVQLGGGNPYSFSDQFSKTVIDAQNQIGTAAQASARVFETVWNGAIDKVTDGFTGMITGSMTVGQALTQIWQGIVTDIIREFVRMAVQWVFLEAFKTTIFTSGMMARETIRTVETGSEAAHVATRTATHAAGETAKTGSTIFGSIARGVARLGETIFHGIQVAVRVVAHLAGETAMTAATLINAPIRITATLAEAVPNLIKAAFKAASSVADVPFAGPILAIAAIGAVIAAGMAAMGAFAEGGMVRGPGSGTSDSVPIYASNGEHVTRASSVNYWGAGFMDAINRGAAGARDVQRMVLAGMARPVTSDRDALAGMPGLTGGIGAAPVVNVAPSTAQVKVVYAYDRQAIRDEMDSSAGKAIIVGTVNDARLKLGIRT